MKRSCKIGIVLSWGTLIFLGILLPVPTTRGFCTGFVSYDAADATFTGGGYSNYAGASVAGVGDVNNDGYDDLLIGAPYYSSSMGRAYLIYGNGSTNQLQGNYDINLAAAIFTGEGTNNYAGCSVAGAGDVNNDGYADFLIGAKIYGSYRGRAYLFYGNGSSNLLEGSYWLNEASAIFTGEGTNNYAGCSVACAGDVNNDGYADFLIGAYAYEIGKGRAYLFYGNGSANLLKGSYALDKANATFTGENSDNYAGCSVAGAGDVNNDGYADFLIGAWGVGTYEGQAYLFYGNGSANLLKGSYGVNKANATFMGENSDNYAGCSVAGAGDVNNDGYADFLIGAYGYETERGRGYLFYGNEGSNLLKGTYGLDTANATFTGIGSYEFAGCSVACAGDVNNDGYADFLIGSIGAGQGRAYLFNGRDNIYGLWGNFYLNQSDLTFNGEVGYDFAGEAVAGAGDLNGDGYDDIIIGAQGFNSYRGRAYLFFSYWNDNLNGIWQDITQGQQEIQCTMCRSVLASLHVEGTGKPVQLRLTVYQAENFPESFDGGLVFLNISINGDPTGIKFPATAQIYYDPALLGPGVNANDLQVYARVEGAAWTTLARDVRTAENFVIVKIQNAGEYVLSIPLPWWGLDPATVGLIFGMIATSIIGIGILRAVSVGGQKRRRIKKLARAEAGIRQLLAFRYAATRVLEEVNLKDITYGV